MKTPTPKTSRWQSTAMFLVAAAGLALQAQTAVVTTDHASYFPQEDIRVTFSGGPGNRLDWIGIYPEGIVPSGNPASTRWYYVDGTQTGTTGLTEGTVTFAGGLDLAGTWVAFLLLNDGYTVAAQTTFTVVEPTAPVVRTDKRSYTAGEAISVTFINGYGNPKDWIGLYPEGETPDGDPPSLDYRYVDGTTSGTTGLANGTVTFPSGISTPGTYTVHFLYDDSFSSIASETFTVVESASQPTRIVSVQPSDQSANLPPVIEYVVRIANGTAPAVASSIQLQVDGAPVSATIAETPETVTVSYTNTTIYAPSSSHTYHLTFQDSAASNYVSNVAIQIAEYVNIVLPAPLYFEDFESTPEDSLPAGWTEKNYTEKANPEFDLGNLDSASYAKWTVVSADRFLGSFVTYSNPDNPDGWETDYQRVLSINPLVVKDGQVYGKPLAEGRFAFANSGYRNGASQVEFLFSPDFNLAGQTNIHLAFHSIWEQNQDSIAAIEYSIDRGQSWLSVAYLLAEADVFYLPDAVTVDAATTLTTVHADVARYFDDEGLEQGGTYGAFIAAPIDESLAPYIQPRIDDDFVGSKRIELYRLPQADNQSAVRLRFAHAGTDSWYFGIDNVGLYSIAPGGVTLPTLVLARNGNQLTLEWPADAAGFVLQSSATLSPGSWNVVDGVTGNSHTVTVSGNAQYYRLSQ